MNAKLAKGAAGIFFILAMALVIMPANGEGYSDGWMSQPSEFDAAAAQDYANDLADGRYDIKWNIDWIGGGYNQSSDYVEAGRYYVGFYEIRGKVVWVSVVDLDAFWDYQADVSWDRFCEMEMDPAAVIEEVRRIEGLEWGRNNTIPDPAWPNGAYDNATSGFDSGTYVVTYLVNGTAAWVSIADKDAYEGWQLMHDAGRPSQNVYQTDMTVREFKDSQLYGRG